MIATYDIETLNMSVPIAVGFFDGKKYFNYLKTNEEADPVWEFLSHLKEDYQGHKVYAHNAVNFDNRFILDSLVKHSERVSFPAGTARIYWPSADVTFEDSYLMLGVGLRKACKAFNLDEKRNWDHEKTVNIWEMGELQEFLAYLERDCRALSEVIEHYCKELLDKLNVTPSMTLALTAVKAFDKNYFKVKDISPNEHVEPFIRAATFGGRNEVFRRWGYGVYLYDIRSMYVSCYDVDVPIGKLLWTKPNIDRPSLAYAEVKIPPMHIGPLPYRYSLNGYRPRLIFPVGEFEGWWDTRELRFAASLGADIHIKRQLEGDEAPILKEFGEKLWELKDTANSDLSRVWKLIGVRLCGKLGQHRARTEISHITDIDDLEGWYPIDDTETYHERVVESKGSRSPYIKPAINMRVRSEARVRHNKMLYKADGKGNLFYCDNDSVYTDKAISVGKGMGELRLIGHASEAWFIRCKFYGYLDDRGELKKKTAGFHEFKLYPSDFRNLASGNLTEIKNRFNSLTPWKNALTGKGVEMKELRRTISNEREFENRILYGCETEPIRLEKVNGVVRHINPKTYSLPIL